MDKLNEVPEEKLEYGTKEYAEARRVRKLDKIPDTHCPISNNTCTSACVCYELPRVVNIGKNDNPFWECQGGFCTAYCLVGLT